MFDTLYSQIGAVFMVAVGLFAFLKGDAPERFGAGVYMLGWLASLLTQQDGELYKAPIGMFVLDTIALFIFAGLAWKAHRAWPIWVTAIQLLVVMTHIMTMIDLRTSLQSLYTIGNLASYLILIALALGTFWAWQERRAAGLE